MSKLNQEVTYFLDNLNHPHREVIEMLRSLILKNDSLAEDIKWNAPNYKYLDNDIITLKIFPTSKIQVILHRGAKVKEEPQKRPLSSAYHLLTWKTNDRAIITFNNIDEVINNQSMFEQIIRDWIIFASK